MKNVAKTSKRDALLLAYTELFEKQVSKSIIMVDPPEPNVSTLIVSLVKTGIFGR